MLPVAVTIVTIVALYQQSMILTLHYRLLELIVVTLRWIWKLVN